MSISVQISDIGLILDLIAVFLLAKYSVPTNTFDSAGSSSFAIRESEVKVALNKDKYARYKKITYVAYILLALGFTLQLQLVVTLLQTMG